MTTNGGGEEHAKQDQGKQPPTNPAVVANVQPRAPLTRAGPPFPTETIDHGLTYSKNASVPPATVVPYGSAPIQRFPAGIVTSAEQPRGAVPPPLNIADITEKEIATPYIVVVPEHIPGLSGPRHPLRISEVIPGQVISQPLPPYPEQALRSGVQGSVILHGIIATDGTVRNLRVLAGHALLVRSAIDAVKKWRYEITYVDRVPTELEFIEEINFSLRGTPQVTLPLDFPKGTTRGRAISQPSPEYPEEALRQRMRGRVILHGIIGFDGAVRNIHVLEGNPLLARAAIDAVSRWRYEASRRDGVPIERPFVVIINFRK